LSHSFNVRVFPRLNTPNSGTGTAQTRCEMRILTKIQLNPAS
jgi:hypothetical protein